MTNTDRINELFEPWQRGLCPGGQVYVAHKGEPVFNRCYGYADLEHNAKINENTVLHVASVSKQFTSMCALILHENGKLSIDNDIRTYIPDLVNFDEPVTVRDMLNNISGIRDQWELQILSGVRMSDTITQSDLLTLVARQRSLNFPPRSKYLYSNSNFSLVSEIIKRVSGVPLNSFAMKNIFKPMGMSSTFFRERYDQIIPNRAMSYIDCWNETYLWKPLNFSNEGATSLHTTAADLIKWLKIFREPTVCSTGTLETMLTIPKLTTDGITTYGCGVAVRSHGTGDNARRTVSHDGADEGYRSAALTIPEAELDIVICANVENIVLGKTAIKIADIMLGIEDDTGISTFNEKYYTPETWDAGSHCGSYLMKEGGGAIDLVKENDNSYLVIEDKKALLKYNSGNCYDAVNSIFKLYKNEAGMFLSAGKDMDITLLSKTTPQFSDLELADMPGIYYCAETESHFEIINETGTLKMRHKRFGTEPIYSLGEDMYACPLEFSVKFKIVKNSAGKVTELELTSGRITAISFRKTTFQYLESTTPP